MLHWFLAPSVLDIVQQTQQTKAVLGIGGTGGINWIMAYTGASRVCKDACVDRNDVCPEFAVSTRGQEGTSCRAYMVKKVVMPARISRVKRVPSISFSWERCVSFLGFRIGQTNSRGRILQDGRYAQRLTSPRSCQWYRFLL